MKLVLGLRAERSFLAAFHTPCHLHRFTVVYTLDGEVEENVCVA